MKGTTTEHEQLKTRRGKSREVSSRFLSSPSSPNRRNSTSNSSINEMKVHLGQRRKHDRMSSDGTRFSFGFSNQSSLQVDTKENLRPSQWIGDDKDISTILPGRFSVDECSLYRASSKRHSSSLSHESSLNDESDSEFSDVSFASSIHKPGIKVSSKYLHGLTARQSKGNHYSLKGVENKMKRNSSGARYGSSMSQWAMSPGRSLETHAVTVTVPSSNLKPPKGKGVSKLFNLGFDFFRSKNKSSSFTSPLKPNTYEADFVHQLKLMNNRLVQWRFVNAKACAANNNVASKEKKQLLCAWDTLTKLKHLVLQERIKLQKKNLEMKLSYVLLSQVKNLEAWEDMERQHLSSLSMTSESLRSVLSRIPLKEGAKVNKESAITLFQNAEAVSDAIISTVNSFAPTMKGIAPLVSQLAEVASQEKLMLEQCHDLLRMISELEMQERSLKCCFLIQHKQSLDTELL